MWCEKIIAVETICKEFTMRVIQTFETHHIQYLFQSEVGEDMHEIVYNVMSSGWNPGGIGRFKKAKVSLQRMKEVLNELQM